MKKFFALVLALVMALSLTTVAWGADAGTYTDFKAAIGGEITLTANIDMPDEVITVTGDTVINLNGFKLNAAANTSRPFNMANGASLTINANDKATSAVVCGKYGLVNIPAGNDAEIILNGGTYTANTDNGSFLKPRGNGVITIEMNNVNYTDSSVKNYLIDASSYTGTDANKLNITVNGGVYNTVHGIISANGVVELNSATLNVKGVGVEVGGEHAKLVANNSTITTTGGNNPSAPSTAIAVSYGASATINGGTYTGSDNASTDGKNAVAIYTTGGSVTVNSGTLNGDVNAITGTGDYDVEITGGTVTGDFKTSGTLADDVDITVSGGTFSADVTDYVEPGSTVTIAGDTVVKNTDGTVAVNPVAQVGTTKYDTVAKAIAAAPAGASVVLLDDTATIPAGYEVVYTAGQYMVVAKTSAAGTTTTLKDADKYDIYGITGTTSVKAAKADIIKKVTDKTTVTVGTTTTVTYTATTYSDGTNVYVEVDSSVADYKLTKNGAIVAYMVNLADVGNVPTTTKTVTSYVAAVEKAACGQYSKTTYPAGVFMIDGVAYEAGVGANWALYNGKFVNYGAKANAVAHTYAVNTYNTTDKSVATLKCTACKQVFTVLTEKQVKTMAPASYAKVTATDANAYFIAVAAAPAAGTTTGTVVESAKTFDAGIAMYVGMSVMAAAGSAVVIGKKKD